MMARLRPLCLMLEGIISLGILALALVWGVALVGTSLKAASAGGMSGKPDLRQDWERHP